MAGEMVNKIRGNCDLPTCCLASFNSAFTWFEKCHLTYLSPFPLDVYNPHQYF